MSDLSFNTPYFLLLFIPYFYLVYLFFFKEKFRRGASIALSSQHIVSDKRSIKTITYPYMPLLRFITLFLLIIALAGPGRSVSFTSIKSQGIDIMIALDLSLSMSAEDLEPNRLSAAKKVLKEFIDKRGGDRIGLVVFAGDAYLQCPPTLEHDFLHDIVDELEFDTVSEDGTAVGNAVAVSAARLMDSSAKSRVLLLITDGVSNRGFIDTETAAESAAEMDMKIYAIGVGRDGEVSFTSPDGRRGRLMNHFDERSLREAAALTGGKFYRADDSGALAESISDIDRLEKSEIETRKYYEFNDKSAPLILFAVSIFFIDILLRSLFYRKIP